MKFKKIVESEYEENWRKYGSRRLQTYEKKYFPLYENGLKEIGHSIVSVGSNDPRENSRYGDYVVQNDKTKVKYRVDFKAGGSLYGFFVSKISGSKENIKIDCYDFFCIKGGEHPEYPGAYKFHRVYRYKTEDVHKFFKEHPERLKKAFEPPYDDGIYIWPLSDLGKPYREFDC
jgi:hypothetical protein